MGKFVRSCRAVYIPPRIPQLSAILPLKAAIYPKIGSIGAPSAASWTRPKSSLCCLVGWNLTPSSNFKLCESRMCRPDWARGWPSCPSSKRSGRCCFSVGSTWSSSRWFGTCSRVFVVVATCIGLCACRDQATSFSINFPFLFHEVFCRRVTFQ